MPPCSVEISLYHGRTSQQQWRSSLPDTATYDSYFSAQRSSTTIRNYLGEVEALGAKSLVDITTNLFRKSDEGAVLERLLSLEAIITTLTPF